MFINDIQTWNTCIFHLDLNEETVRILKCERNSLYLLSVTMKG